ncbi:unnamed protein product [Ixodes persulcatus]
MVFSASSVGYFSTPCGLTTSQDFLAVVRRSTPALCWNIDEITPSF